MNEKRNLIEQLRSRNASERGEAAEALLRCGIDCTREVGRSFDAVLRVHRAVLQRDWGQVINAGRCALPALSLAANDEDNQIRQEACYIIPGMIQEHLLAPLARSPQRVSVELLGHDLLAPGTVLKSHETIRDSCDYAIDMPGTWPSPDQLRDTRSLDQMLAAVEQAADGASIYVRSDLMDAFFERAFPRLHNRVVLVTAGEDDPTPGAHAPSLDDPRILRWFGQNCDLEHGHPKFVPMPIGVTDRHIPWGNQRLLLDAHRLMPPLQDKPTAVLANFHISLNHPQRRDAFRALHARSFITFQERWKPPIEIWTRHADFAFEVCPRGNGLDCHRPWEALLLRTIPIVKRSTLDPVFRDLPVVFVESWGEIDADSLAAWQAERQDAFTAEVFDRITSDFWQRQIQQAASLESVGALV